MDFIAIDFETANYQPTSAISLAVVKVVNGVIESKNSWLIKPPTKKFNDEFIDLHGITWEDVEWESTFEELWDEVEPYIAGQILVAHNASFDINVLKSLIKKYKIDPPKFNYICSLEASRKMGSYESNTLASVAKRLEIELDHHNAESDALVCAKIILNFAKSKNIRTINDLINKLDLSVGNQEKNIKTTYNKRSDYFENDSEEWIEVEPSEEHKIFSRLVDKNGQGLQLEREGHLDKAIEIFEQVIKENFTASSPYERLRIIYHKKMQYDDEIRIIKKAIDMYEKLQLTSKYLDYSPYIEKLKKHMNKTMRLIAK